jgi:TPR repeat protein
MKTSVLIAIMVLQMTSRALASECREQLEPLLVSEQPKATVALFEVCKAEAAAGDAEALYWVSFFYFGLLEYTSDERRGVESTTASAEKGYAQAQYWMGWQSEIGGLLPQDAVAAVAWYKRAAESNNWLALERLSRAYRNAELGLERDIARAEQYAARRP